MDLFKVSRGEDGSILKHVQKAMKKLNKEVP